MGHKQEIFCATYIKLRTGTLVRNEEFDIEYCCGMCPKKDKCDIYQREKANKNLEENKNENIQNK